MGLPRHLGLLGKTLARPGLARPRPPRLGPEREPGGSVKPLNPKPSTYIYIYRHVHVYVYVYVYVCVCMYVYVCVCVYVYVYGAYKRSSFSLARGGLGRWDRGAALAVDWVSLSRTHRLYGQLRNAECLEFECWQVRVWAA